MCFDERLCEKYIYYPKPGKSNYIHDSQEGGKLVNSNEMILPVYTIVLFQYYVVTFSIDFATFVLSNDIFSLD